MGSRGECYLSLVLAARNDDHGGNMLGRMQGMLDTWVGQAERYGLPSEIVVVEWNPPAERPRLKESLRWPSRPEHCQVRFVEVPPEIHVRFKNAVPIPLHQMIAKNVGIRRACGEFVLATNLDILFSAELVRFLAERRLENGVMYRLDRHDVAKAVPANASLDELLAFCETHLLRVAAREGEFQLSGDGQRALDQQDIVAEDAGVRFGTGWSPVQCSEGLRYRWLESESELRFEQPAGDARELLLTAEVGPSAGREPVTLEIRNQAGSTLAAVAVTDRCQLRIQMPSGFSENALILRVHGADLPITRQPRIANLRVLALKWDTPPGRKRCAGWSIEVLDTGPAFDWAGSFDAASPFSQEIRNAAHLHISACGDFTLLSRENWFRLRAYPEFPIWPMHIDALLCYTAYHAGIRESILREPMRIYHVEHGSGAGWTPEGEQERIARVKSKGVSELTYAGFAKWVDLMRRYDSPVICNGGNWGLGDVDLFEQTVWR